MPTYEYRCEVCEHTLEAFQSITATPLKTCPACGRSRLQRLIGTGAGVLFRGSGFYQTDYRSESYKKAAQAEKKAASATDTQTKSGASPSSNTGAGGSTSTSAVASRPRAGGKAERKTA